MYFCKLGFVGASVLLGCWAVVQANPAPFEAPAPSDNDAFIQHEELSRSDRCTSPSGLLGVCRSFFDCAIRGGRSDGGCGFLGLGVCCIPNLGSTTKTCNSLAEAQVTMFANPENAGTGSAACSLTVSSANNICQLRLDFTELSLAQPDIEGVCASSYLSVTGGSTVPKICGENAGQHIYVDVSEGVDVAVGIIGQTADDKWNIKVTKILCESDDLAPEGCLQYFTDPSGTISSFNYDDSDNTVSFQLSDQAYDVCFKPGDDYCSITYSQAPDSPFSVSFDPKSLPPGIPPPPFVDDDCTTDYVTIQDATITDNSNIAGNPTSASLFCGIAFPGATSSSFILSFMSDENEAAGGDSYNNGFKLDYTLNSC